LSNPEKMNPGKDFYAITQLPLLTPGLNPGIQRSWKSGTTESWTNKTDQGSKFNS